MDKIRKILIPVDGSDSSSILADYGRFLAEAFPCEIVLLNVQDIDASDRPSMNIGFGIVEAAKLKIGQLTNSKSRISTHVAFGNPAEVILDIAEDENFDFILICTHGLGAAKRFQLGSVTNKVVTHSTVPVLILR